MNILIKASTFGADLFSFAYYLDKLPGVTLKILLPNPEKFLEEGVSKLYPLNAELTKKRFRHYWLHLSSFRPDVTIMDKEIPLIDPSPNGLMLWHGFGWKGPNDVREWRWLHRSIQLAWGSAKKSNPNFRWQCFGAWDFDHRTKISGIHPDNCRILGSASHDILRSPLPKEELQPYYPFDIVNKKTILIAPTWHYGEVFSHWGNDTNLFKKLISHIEEQDANIILRLHDSYRLEDYYVKFFEQLALDHPNVLLKFKDHNPDNLLDMMASDVLLTNFSSIANLYYATGRPTVHIYPVKSEDEEFLWRRNMITGIKKIKVDSVKYIWKLPPEENGGFLAMNFEEMIDQLDDSLAKPDCCQKKSKDFLDKYMLGGDGKSCERIWRAVQELVND